MSDFSNTSTWCERIQCLLKLGKMRGSLFEKKKLQTLFHGRGLVLPKNVMDRELSFSLVESAAFVIIIEVAASMYPFYCDSVPLSNQAAFTSSSFLPSDIKLILCLGRFFYLQ